LPSLSRQHTSDNKEKFNKTMDWALRWILLIALPAAVALMILSQPILTVLFEYGKTTASDTAMSSLSLKAYALGLLAFMLIKVLAPGYFARQDMKTPVKIGIIAMGINMLFNIALVVPFHYFWQIGHVGLALATSLSAFINAALLYRGLRKSGVYQPINGWGIYLLRLFVANGAMAAVLLASFAVVADWSDLQLWERIITMAIVCVVGLLVYLLSLLVLGVRLRHVKLR
jgi:putative peptidoglycan lipid II flippase